MKEAILVVSFGTSYPETLEKNIAAIETDIGHLFPHLPLRRAFTSGMILRRWASRGVEMDDVPAALRKLEADGVARVILQPTHIMNGDEYDKLTAQAQPFTGRMELRMGTPLLTELEDYQAVAEALQTSIAPPAEDEAVVFMGHGTEHYANPAYLQMEYLLHDLGWKRAFFGTVEGYPGTDEVMRRLAEHPEVKKVRLYPFMVVAGDHAQNDMAGPEPDSWKNRMEQAGYQVEPVLRGLGEYPAIRAIFADHAKRAAEG